MKITVELEYDIGKLYQMSNKKFVQWYNILNYLDKKKYDLFIEINRHIGKSVMCLEDYEGYYKVVPEPQLVPFELNDYKAIAGSRIKHYFFPDLTFIIVDVNNKTNKVIVYDEVTKKLTSNTIKKMHYSFVRLDGTKFEKEYNENKG